MKFIKVTKVIRNCAYDLAELSFCHFYLNWPPKWPTCYFLLPISRESIVFGSNFRNEDFYGFTRFEVY